jgi:hypothetical protein
MTEPTDFKEVDTVARAVIAFDRRKGAFGPMKKPGVRSLAAIGAALCTLAACGGGDKTADSYPRASLRTLTRGRPAPSVGFRYQLVDPSIESVYRNVGIVRDGNIVEFIAGRNLEDKLGGASRGVSLAVVKEYSPFVHFRVERVYTARDTTFLTPGTLFLPEIVDAAAFSVTPYERIDFGAVRADRTEGLRALENRKIRFVCSIAEVREGGASFFVLSGQNVKLRVAAVSDGMGAVLRLLASRGYLFEGGGALTAVEDPASRAGAGIAGTVEVEWVKYGRRVVSG